MHARECDAGDFGSEGEQGNGLRFLRKLHGNRLIRMQEQAHFLFIGEHNVPIGTARGKERAVCMIEAAAKCPCEEQAGRFLLSSSDGELRVRVVFLGRIAFDGDTLRLCP